MPLITRADRVCLVLGLMALPALSQTKSVSWSGIGNSVEIIGRVGVPLGTAVTVAATVADVSVLPEPSFLKQHQPFPSHRNRRRRYPSNSPLDALQGRILFRV